MSDLHDLSAFKSDYYDLPISALHNGEISEVRLSDFGGKFVVILFYRNDFTQQPREEIIQLIELHQKFDDLDCQVLKMAMELFTYLETDSFN